MPEPAANRTGVGPAILLSLAAVAILAICRSVDFPSGFQKWLSTDLMDGLSNKSSLDLAVLMVLGTLALVFVPVVVHELGHVACGLCAGFRFHSLRVGPVQWDRQLKPSRYQGSGDSLGAVIMFPERTDALPLRAALLLLGGSGANVLTFLVILFSSARTWGRSRS